jgi:beta-lactam-binding protein with PASTA domain
MTTLLEGKDPGVFPENPPGTDEFFKTPVSIVPTFVGLTVDQARQLALESRVLIQVIDVPSLEPVGTVVSQSAAPGATIPQGVPVSIGVSTGVPPVGALPAVIGLPFDQAVAALQAFSEETYVQLTILRQDAPTADPAKKGTVLAMNPPPGTQVGSGIQVILTVGV